MPYPAREADPLYPRLPPTPYLSTTPYLSPGSDFFRGYTFTQGKNGGDLCYLPIRDQNNKGILVCEESIGDQCR